MTREEAIAELSVLHERLSNPKDCEDGCYSWEDGWYVEAIDIAIEALSADTVSREHHDMEIKELKHQIKDQADMVSVVRCKDCKWAEADITHLYCSYFGHKVYEDDYCSDGKRQCNYFGERREE